MKQQGVVPFTTAYKQRDPIDSIRFSPQEEQCSIINHIEWKKINKSTSDPHNLRLTQFTI